MFVCTRSTVAHGGRHAAPLGDAGFPLVLQGILIDSLVSHWGVLEQDHFLGGAIGGDSLDFPMVFDDFCYIMFGFRLLFFSAKQEMHVFPLFLKVFGLLFFLTGLLHNDLQRQALFMLSAL